MPPDPKQRLGKRRSGYHFIGIPSLPRRAESVSTLCSWADASVRNNFVVMSASISFPSFQKCSHHKQNRNYVLELGKTLLTKLY